jgi:hypothetical protein
MFLHHRMVVVLPWDQAWQADPSAAHRSLLACDLLFDSD